VTIAIKDKVVNKDPDAVNVIVIGAADIVHKKRGSRITKYPGNMSSALPCCPVIV